MYAGNISTPSFYLTRCGNLHYFRELVHPYYETPLQLVNLTNALAFYWALPILTGLSSMPL
jgi:hypothetical protein